MKTTLLGYENYKTYLLDRLNAKEGLGKGARSRLCEAMRCQGAYLSQVLKGSAHLSPEQADAANRFLGHTEEESEYFLLLLQYARAGTDNYRAFVQRLLQKFKKRRAYLKERLEPQDKELSLEQKIRYYSAWYYAAIHIFTTIPGAGKIDIIHKRLGLEPVLVAKVLEFLLSCGLVVKKKEIFEASVKRLHMDHDSDLAIGSHSSWRLRSMQSLSGGQEEDLHYSSAVTLSKKDAIRIREQLIDSLAVAKETIRNSPAEELYCLSLDWFAL